VVRFAATKTNSRSFIQCTNICGCTRIMNAALSCSMLTILQRKNGTLFTNLCHKPGTWGRGGRRRGQILKNQTFHRRAATHTHGSTLRPLHKTLLQKCIHRILTSTKRNQKTKLRIFKALLTCTSKADCIRIAYAHNPGHVDCARFTKFAVYHHLHATISQHCQH
jgi:hypothetical protein